MNLKSTDAVLVSEEDLPLAHAPRLRGCEVTYRAGYGDSCGERSSWP